MFCCNMIKTYIEGEDHLVNYSEILREYSVKIVNNDNLTLIYCPWCGQKFPKSLRNEWFDTLMDMGFENPWDAYEEEDPNFPEAFKSDAWWKKRGL